MDVNDLRSAVTFTLFVLFLALVVYTWSRKRKREYDEAAMLPFAESQAPVESRGDKP